MSKRPSPNPYDPFPNALEPYGADDLQYVATLVNPVDRRPVMVVVDAMDAFICMPVDELKGARQLGDGSIQDPRSGISKKYTRCGRAHVKVIYAGVGHGLMLYSGLALATDAILRGVIRPSQWRLGKTEEGCVGSSRGIGRSPEADHFWKEQVRRGLAKVEHTPARIFREFKTPISSMPSREQLKLDVAEQDGFKIRKVKYVTSEFMIDVDAPVETLSAADVRAAGLVLDEIGGSGSEIPTDVLLELDLRATSSLNLRTALTDEFNRRGVSEQRIDSFLDRNNRPMDHDLFSRASEARAGAKKALSKRRTRKNNDAWNEFYGELTHDAY